MRDNYRGDACYAREIEKTFHFDFPPLLDRILRSNLHPKRKRTTLKGVTLKDTRVTFRSRGPIENETIFECEVSAQYGACQRLREYQTRFPHRPRSFLRLTFSNVEGRRIVNQA